MQAIYLKVFLKFKVFLLSYSNISTPDLLLTIYPVENKSSIWLCLPITLFFSYKLNISGCLYFISRLIYLCINNFKFKRALIFTHPFNIYLSDYSGLKQN